MSLNFRVKTWNQKPGTRNLKLGTAVRLMLLTLLMLVGGIANMANAASYQYTYIVVNLNGEIATQAKATQEAGTTPVIPDVIKSSLLADGTAGTYSYYTLDQFDVASNIYTLHESPTALAALPSAATNIYVKYTYNNASSSIDLSGNTIYYIKDQDKNDPTKVHYMTFNKKWTSADWRTDGSTNADDNFGDNDKERQWVYEGNDPYKIYIRNVYRRDAGADSYVRTELAKGKFEDNNNVRYGGLNTDKLFNTFFFDNENHIVAANNVYNWNGTTNRYIYYAKEDKNSYGDIGGRFLTTGTARLNLTTLNIVKSTVTDATIHLVNQTAEPHKETFSFNTPIDTDNPKPSATVLARLTRLGATLGTTYYKVAALTNPITTPLEVTDIYIPYTVDAATLSSTYNITFSTEANPEWFSMVCTRNSGKQMVYNSSTNEINSSQGVSTARAEAITGQYAFIGDPYSFRVITKSADGQYAYVDTENDNKVRFSDTPDNWALIPGTADGTFQIFRRDDFLSTYRAFWDAYNGGNQIRMTAQSSGSDLHANRNITATPTPKYNYTYNIVDNNGRIAIKYTIEQYVSTRLDGDHGYEAIPAAIRSPYIEGETLTFYTTLLAAGSRSNLSGDITATGTPAAAGNIYVSYTNSLLSTRTYPLDGTKSYFMQLGDHYVIHTSGVGTQSGRPSVEETGKEAKIWILENSDPYDVCVKNSATGNYKLFDNTDIHFFLMDGKGTEDGQIELLFASGEDISSKTSYSLTLNSTAVNKSTTVRHSDNQQIIFSEAVLERTYRLIDKQGKILLEYKSKELENSGELGVPAKWRSPLINYVANADCGYHYYIRSSFDVSGNTYTLRGDAVKITAPTQSTDGYIYVTYDAMENNILSVVDPTKKAHRNNDPTEPFVRQATEFGQIFMIKFSPGKEFYQENSDALETEKTLAQYPYSNGDSGFNLYGDTDWDVQRQQGSSTRTRWSWFVASPYNDPYRVVITSWQNSHAGKANSSDAVNTNFYNYWRTYYNTTVGGITTGTITDDPQVTNTANTGGSADNVATEYMLLGTTGHYKLVTCNEIDNGVTVDANYGKHRPVSSFLQYWKTYETISRKGELSYTELVTYETNSKSYFTNANITDDPVYRFQAWHNARPIDPDAPTTQLSKKYAYDYHFYQNINLGSEFDLIEHSIDGILILLDNHGWEIMRKPMAKTGAANKATRDADIMKFNSPMVKQYHFYQTGTKATGYHKYTVASEKGTGATLADYPEVLNTNLNLVDLYVTYDVRPEYAELYSTTMTISGSDTTFTRTPTEKPYIIRQDSKLAKATDATTLTAEENTTCINAIDAGTDIGLTATANPEYFWYLKPNEDIDLEMGYAYLHKANGTLSQNRTDSAYVASGKAGFDPYNIQIQNKSFSEGWFTTRITNSVIDNNSAMLATYPEGTKTVSLSSHAAVNTAKNLGTGHDNVAMHITNQTFMAVQDGNGNMRIIPRFDHYNAINDFTTLVEKAADQPADDKKHAQSTWLLRPPACTYIVIDNKGREAVRYTTLSNGAPTMPAKFRSPLAKNFTFWKTGSASEGIYTLNYQITGSFAEDNVEEGATIYVRYEYNPEGDTDGVLKGTWYHATLNDGSTDQDVKVTTSGIQRETFTNDAAHRWRFMNSAGDSPDPYAVTLYNGTISEGHHESESGTRYIVMHHFDGTDTEDYALMQAGVGTATYQFLDGGAATATIAAEADYAKNGEMTAAKKLKLTPVLATGNVVFKIITKNNKVVALTSETVAVADASTKLADIMPAWMKTPLMKSDAYIFYSAATEDTSTDPHSFTIGGEPTTTATTLDDNTVYVSYDYDKSKVVVESFGVGDPVGYTFPLNRAALDLSGKVPYAMFFGSTDNGNMWTGADNNGKISTPANNTVWLNYSNEYLTNTEALFYCQGNDPYEVTFRHISDEKVLSGKVPTGEEKATKYPLVYLKDDNSDTNTYPLRSFMVLRMNPNETNPTGTLKLYVTGHDDIYLAESGKLAGGVFLYQDSEDYKTRVADASGEPVNPVDNTMKIYSRFIYRPYLRYHVITNDGREALTTYGHYTQSLVELPEMYQSPLLNSSDFSYYTGATYDKETGKYTVKGSVLAANTTVATAAAASYGDIYVRYTYDRDKSPYKIATSVNNNSEDGTYLGWTDESGLDLSGKTWYTMADMQYNFNTAHGTLLGVDSETTFKKTDVSALTNGHAPSTKDYLWKLEGNDPYAIKISSGSYDGKYITINTASSNKQQLLTTGAKQTFMLLQACAADNEIGDFSTDDNGDTNYQLLRWAVLMTTGSSSNGNGELLRTAATSNTSCELTTWSGYASTGFKTYDIRLSSGEVVKRKILYRNSGGTTDHAIEFVKAPVARKYHYHAIKYEGSTRIGQTWDAVLEHDWLQDIVLEPAFARLYCKYEKRNTAATGDDVTGTGDFQTQAALEAEGQPNAQFYSDLALTQRVKDTGTGRYDIYPEIPLEEVYDIYFKYQVDNEAKVNNRTLSDITSSDSEIASDATYYNGTGKGRMDPDYTRQANWWFMVLDTDAGVTATGTGDSRTFTGSQYFLRREDDGTVNWMDNSYTLHKEDADNYKSWPYSRLAEWYRKGDNDAFREGRWLWTFVGNDPYNMRIVNFESVVGVQAESQGVYTLAAADNCFATINEVTTTTNVNTYPVTIPTEEPSENQYWGLCAGYGTEQTFSLLSTALTSVIDKQTVNQPLYWAMVSRTTNRVTTEGVEGAARSNSRANAIQLLPYVPQRYEDVKVVIRRDDEVAEYKAETKALSAMTTGLSKLYFAAWDRMYVKDDKISLSAENNSQALPLNVRRAFCDYTLYESTTPFDTPLASSGYYTVKAGPYPTTTSTGEYDEDGREIYTYQNSDGTNAPDGAQAIYASYKVTSDIFLKTPPSKTEVEAMAQNNDHVYFMDFPDTSGKDTYHHAYYDPMSTMREKTGDLKSQRDSKTGVARPEKKKKSGSTFVDDNVAWYNHYQYRTASDRMESVPQNLKWYFVGDPYKMQVYNVAGAWNTETLKDNNGADIAGKTAGTVAANLARFNTKETNFQFVVDCVHLRVPDYTLIDNEATLQPYKEDGTIDTEAASYPNRHYNKPYFDDFYWECVPTTSDEDGTFALRFKEDNPLLGYRNVYYYLAHDGLSKTYEQKNYSINLSYNADNKQHQSGTYAGYHTANDVNTVIKLVQPVKVYVTAHRADDGRYTSQSNVVKDELSEYYGLNETITAVPRHLQRKFVKYNDLTDQHGSTTTEHELTIANASSSDDCSSHAYHKGTDNSTSGSDVFKTDTKINPVFKFSVYYTVDDLSTDSEGNTAHLFSPSTSSLEWVDMSVDDKKWLYFNKEQSDKTQLSNYRTAVGDNNADGWNDGLKGLHWALVGDPYDFAILNRRRYEDGKNSEEQWLQVVKTHVRNKANTADSVIWVTQLADYNATTPTAAHAASTQPTSIADATVNTRFSVQMWKLGNANYYFLRTASLKTGTDDGINGSTTNETNNYWRMVYKVYTDATPKTYHFEMVPYSLSEKSNYTNTQYYSNFSETMNGLGVYQQRLEIRTAVAKDEDEADNNCFDADVEIRTATGVLRLTRSDMEIRYGDVEAALPVSLRRYGCSYKCYLNYDAATNSGTEIDYFGEFANEEGYAELTAAMTAARTAHDADATKSPRPLLTYVYTVNDDVAQYFTSEQNARTEDYQWANCYFYWMQSYNTAGVEVERTKQVFDHYVYNSAGQIIDEVYREERYTELSKGGSEEYPTKGYLNMHSGTPVYADEIVQSKEDRQKWAMTGDPYGFTMKNYAQYLNESNAIVNVDNSGNVITQNYGDGQQFAYVVGKDGTPFLAVIDATGNITRLTDFEYSSTSDKSLYTVSGSGVNDNDPTGNTLTTNYRNTSGDLVTVKPFYLTNLMSYADIVQYHLVMAHQYSLDYSYDGLTETQITNLKADVDKRMLEFLMYWGIKDHSSKSYFIGDNFGSDGTPTTYDTKKENDIKALLKEKGTLRNFYSYPVEDQEVDRIGVGNRPQLPWYMKRQFCTYYMYQRDVQRSVTTNFPAFQEADASWTGLTCTISIGQEYTDYNNNTYTFSAGEDFNTYYAGKTFKSNDGTNPIPMTFVENGVTKQAFNVKWESIFDKSHWAEVSATDLAATTETSARTAAGWEDVSGTWRKKPSGYDEALDLQGVILDKLYDCHQNRKVLIDVIYEVKPETFRFAQAGRNTTAWYQMMTNNYLADGLLNFSYKDGIGGRLDRTHHYTNNYLWAPEGDPYGFVLRSRYATINGTGWDDVAVTTEGRLPKGANGIYINGSGETVSNYTEASELSDVTKLKASYTGNSSSSHIPFNHKRIIHRRQGDKIDPTGSDEDSNKAQTDGATNAVYEMFVGGYDGSFLMHPTAAWMDNSDVDHQSYYMMHETTSHEGYTAHRAYLEKFKADDLRYMADANWRLECTPAQLLPYFQRAGYVGGLRPAEAEKFTNQEYYNRLKNGDTFTFTELTALQNLVYGGTFYKSDGKTEVDYTDPRPTGTDLPMKFVSNNLVTMTPGYYRIKAFSEDALNVDGADLVGDGSGIKGVTGPRYISGYRFNSAKTDTKDPKNYGGRWLHFFETDMAHSDIHTYADLKAKITAAQAAGQTDRDLFDHPAMSGNIEILPADFDPSSIFQFIEDSRTESYTRYNIKTQGLTLWARPGSSEDDATAGNHDFGRTELVESTPSAAEGYTNDSNHGGWDNKFRLEDIGGAATTIRVREVQDDNWDVMVAENLKTNYVCIDGKHRYRITCHKDNEMVEIGDHYTTDGINGIQDTKWLLQPVGMREEWPYNQMPLRVEVQRGGVRNQELTGSDLTNEANKDQYYYGSLYVPFDTRLANTTDGAFTLTNDATANTGQVTMQSLSQLNGMGNPQYVPAAWPVILRTNHPNSVKLMNQPVGEALATEYATRHYVNMYLPYSEPQGGLDAEKATIKLRGEYLERTLDDSYMRTKEGVDDYTLSGKSIMVFGIPFKAHTGEGAHEYDREHKQVGFYTNENWYRGHAEDNNSATSNDGSLASAHLATARNATDDQRSNLYVYHNKVYYPYTLKDTSGSAPALKHIVALFDETNIDDEPFYGDVTDDVPWPCDVYDLQGRKVAANETPATLLLNHPELAKGVYIFGGRKMIIK